MILTFMHSVYILFPYLLKFFSLFVFTVDGSVVLFDLLITLFTQVQIDNPSVVFVAHCSVNHYDSKKECQLSCSVSSWSHFISIFIFFINGFYDYDDKVILAIIVETRAFQRIMQSTNARCKSLHVRYFNGHLI